MAELLEFLATLCRSLVIIGVFCLLASIPFFFLSPPTAVILLIAAGTCLGVGLIPYIYHGIKEGVTRLSDYVGARREAKQTQEALDAHRQKLSLEDDESIEPPKQPSGKTSREFKVNKEKKKPQPTTYSVSEGGFDFRP